MDAFLVSKRFDPPGSRGGAQQKLYHTLDLRAAPKPVVSANALNIGKRENSAIQLKLI